MKKLSKYLTLLLLSVAATACFEDMDDVVQPASTRQIQTFIYSAMNIWYLYKPDVPDLANDRFASQGELDEFLGTFDSPETLFYGGLTTDIDRFSFMTDDYRVLLDQLSGVYRSHGMEYGLVYYPGSETLVFGYVQYVIPGSDAAGKGMERGQIFNRINGTQLTVNNYRQLAELDSYELGLATFDGTTVTPIEEQVLLVKTELTENPVHLATTFTIEGQKVGYLLYNGFTGTFDSQLNQAFDLFQAENIDELILDLRYNSGGSVRTATALAGMITGQFTGQIFYKEQWNPELQAHFEQTAPNELVGNFTDRLSSGEVLNSLQRSKVYVLTTRRTASASELVINGLIPYIEVVQVGENTTGKFQASTTFFDSDPPNFQRSGARLGHYYAIQPLIYTTENAAGNSGQVDGLPPDIEGNEDFANLGILGDPNETLLSLALDDILGRMPRTLSPTVSKEISNSKKHFHNYQRMYADEVGL